MLNALNLARIVYRGYKGDGECHIVRVFLGLFTAIIIAVDPKGLNKDTLSVIAVIVSVLAGFSFTALFSSHSHSTSDLPVANSESDRHDLEKLKGLFKNFRDRARYFLFISVVCLFSIFLLSIPLDLNSNNAFIDISSLNLVAYAGKVWLWLCLSVRFLAIMMFLEILYTFYRLSETIFSILDTRRSYLDGIR